MLKPPPDFRSNFEATPPPILIDNGIAVLENDKIERHIMKSIPGGHNLFIQDKEVASKIENVYSKFKIMLLKKDDHSKSALLSNLRKINDHLEQKGSRFLTGDTMCCFDCELMPKLQVKLEVDIIYKLLSKFLLSIFVWLAHFSQISIFLRS